MDDNLKEEFSAISRARELEVELSQKEAQIETLRNDLDRALKAIASLTALSPFTEVKALKDKLNRITDQKTYLEHRFEGLTTDHRNEIRYYRDVISRFKNLDEFKLIIEKYNAAKAAQVGKPEEKTEKESN